MGYRQETMRDATVFRTRVRHEEVARFFDGDRLADPPGLKAYEDACFRAFVEEFGLPWGDGRRNVVFFISDLSGCGYVRGLVPARSIQRGSTRYNAIVSESVCTELVRWADIVVWQRQNNPDLVGAWRVAKTTGKVQVYELDDNLHEVPKTNPVHRLYQPGSPSFRHSLSWMKSCDAMLVSTKPLAEYYGRALGRACAVIENTIDASGADAVPPRGEHERVRILWAGSPTHVEDLAVVSGAIRKVRDAFGKRVKFVMMGFDGRLTLPIDPDDLERGGPTRHDAGVKHDKFVPWRGDVDGYHEALARSGFDIGLCPLADNTFNRCKSHIKWLEYSVAGLATVATALPPYALSIRHGHDGLLVDNSEAGWAGAIGRLVEDRALRRTLVDNARATIRERFDSSAVWQRYEQFFDTLRPAP